MKILIKILLLIYLTPIASLAQVVTCDTSNQGNFQTHPDSQITFFGNLENTDTGNITENGGRVSFTNSDTSLRITGANTPVFSELFVNVDDNLILEVPVDVTTGLFFDQGLIITPRNTEDISINLRNNAIDSNKADSRHVDGYISYTGNSDYTFPVGDDDRLRSLSIESGASVNTSKAAYFYENPESSLSFPLSLDRGTREDGLSNISSFEFWDLNGDTSTQVTLTWDILSNISQILDSQPLSELTVVGWSKDTQEWINLGNTNISGNEQIGTITSESFIPDDFEAITFAVLGEIKGGEGETTELTVFNGLSSGDNDNQNDFLSIQNISQFPNNTLKIFNRWGIKVFDVDGYDAEPKDSRNFKPPTNAFVGRSNGRITVKEGDLLPVGTYYYILDYEVDSQGGRKTLAGYLYINR